MNIRLTRRAWGWLTLPWAAALVIAAAGQGRLIEEAPAPPLAQPPRQAADHTGGLPLTLPPADFGLPTITPAPAPTTTTTPTTTTKKARTPRRSPRKTTPLAPHRAAAPAPTTVQQSAPPAASSRSAQVVAAARTYIGVPYLWGGVTRLGLDCSGLTSLALNAAGYNPPRTAAQQAAWAAPITHAQAHAGDLVFDGHPAGHVGVYLGDGLMIDASDWGTLVAVRPIHASAYFGRPPA